MDERDLRERLRSAAESVLPSSDQVGDLADQARSRYLRRRVRGRVVVAVVVIALVGSGVATAALVGHDHGSPTAVAPAPTTPSTGPAGPVDVSGIGSMTFTDASKGYGVESSRYLVRSSDGGRTWRRVGLVPSGDRYVRFAPVYAKSLTDLVAWGDGPLSQSTDGGAHWRTTLGPSVYAVSEASFRLWATIACTRGSASPCTPQLETSVDGGATWTDPPTPLQLGLGAQAIDTPSGTSVYLVDGDLMVTHDGGRSWTHEPAPPACESRPVPAVAVDAGTLLLVCSPSPQLGEGVRAFVSVDEGRSWQAAAPLPSEDSLESATVTATDTGFVVAPQTGPLLVTTDHGASWHAAFPVGAHDAILGIDREYGLGVWVAAASRGIWFSPDGVHWQRRTGAAPTSISTSTTSPANGVQLRGLGSLSFVNATTGFGLASNPDRSQELVRSETADAPGGASRPSIKEVTFTSRTHRTVWRGVPGHSSSRPTAARTGNLRRVR